IKVSRIENVAVVSAVGAGMAGTPGVAGKIFSALGRNGINVIMISQSCSEYNVSFAVKSEDGINAVRVVHDEFGLNN
ncbi:MAG: ACT domain-containing protein, partial [Archaeoglobaceae archaeon]